MSSALWIDKAKIDRLIKDMIRWRDSAHESYRTAIHVKDLYVDSAADRGISKAEAELRAVVHPEFVAAVANNRMYDRFTTRDAAVLSALASLSTAGLLEVRE
jgi:hypothetical protein